MFSLSSGTANAEWVELGTVDSGFSFSRLFNLDTSDYVSEQNVASNSLTFSLANTQTLTFFADSFAFTNDSTEFRQIDLLNQGLANGDTHDVNFITSIGDFYNGLDGQAPILTYELGPGVYQVNYKVLGQELGWSADRVVGTAVEGLGNYRLGFNVGETIVTDLLNAPAVAAVPEPETYAMLLTGLLLIGFSAARRNAAGKRLV
ncbi:MAG: hypothetical protein CVU27_02785 [Betaproteobacteria bacterium HGW-Betaproteobacteria-20]|nr:MAG: hypothetical protein CVU27_02785 [Betaproteobacteria bacterium HGW-Betaproteobacteria-20]